MTDTLPLGGSTYAAEISVDLLREPFVELVDEPVEEPDWQERALPGTHAFVVELWAGGLDIRASGRYVTALRSLLDNTHPERRGCPARRGFSVAAR